MREVKFLTWTFGAVCCLLIAGPASAEMQNVNFDVKTTANGDQSKRVDFWVKVEDSTSGRQPDFVKSIKVTAPGGTVINIDPVWDYDPYFKEYYKSVGESNFTDAMIPKGTYSVEVVDIGNKLMSQSDNIDATFLPLPVITQPTADAVVGPTPLLRWRNLTAAKVYRIFLYNESWNQWVYEGLKTQSNSFQIPLGDLKPNCYYSLRIDARSAAQDVDKRSRTNWLGFSTQSSF